MDVNYGCKGRIVLPEEFAFAVLANVFLANGKVHYITGNTVDINGM